MVSATSAWRPMLQSALAVMLISLARRRLMTGMMARISCASPELEMAMTMSWLVTMPKSPWLASPGCIKKAGVPVEASVAAILLPIWPDLPMPVTTTRPVQFSISWHAWLKLSSSSGFKLINASISVCTTRCPEFMKVCWLIARVIVDKNELLIMANDVNCHQS